MTILEVMALSRHRGCYVGISVTLFAATAALALRLYARQLTRVRLGIDDYLCIVAYVSYQLLAQVATQCVLAIKTDMENQIFAAICSGIMFSCPSLPRNGNTVL